MAILGGDGSIILTTKIDQSGLNKGMASLKGAITKLGAAIGVAFGVRALVQFGKQAVQLASDLQEVQNVVDVAFGDMAYRMEQFANTAIETFGISKLTAKQTGSSYMAMAKSMQIADDAAADMALTLTGLSADMASFYNIHQSEARTALSAVFTGETETLKRYGILITEVNLQEYARQQGITKSINAMTQQEKVMLRYQYVLQATQLAQGDFVRTQDSWANQTRILSERWKEMQTVFGEAFMTIGVLVLPVINNIIVGLTKVAEMARVVAQWIYKAFTGKELKTTQSQGTALSGVGAGATEAANGMEALGDATEKANKEAKKALAGFDDLQILTSNIAENTNDASRSISGIGGTTGLGGVSFEEQDTGQEEKFSWLEGKLERLKKAFSDLNNIDVSRLTESVEGLVAPIKELGEIYWEDLIWGIENLFVPLTTFVANEILPNFLEKIGDRLTNLNKILEKARPVLKDFADKCLKPIAKFATGKILEFWEFFNRKLSEIEGMLANSELWADIKTVFDFLYPIIVNVINALSWFLDLITTIATTHIFNDLKTIINDLGDVFGFLAAIIQGDFSDAFKHLKELLIDNRIQDAKDDVNLLKDSFVKIIEPIKNMGTIFKNTISEMISNWKTNIENWWNNNVTPWFTKEKWEELFFKIGESLANSIVGANGFVEKWETNITNWWNDDVAPWFTTAKWKEVFNNIVTSISNFFTAEDGFVQTWKIKISEWWTNEVTPWFTVEKWKELGEHIKDGLVDGIYGAINGIREIINKILDGFQGLVNGAIDMLNSLISGWNKVADVTPGLSSISSIKHIDLSKYKLPELSQGTVVPPNRKFAAIFGDNTKEHEIVSPLSTMKQAFTEAMLELGGNFGGGNTEVVLEIDGREFGRAVVEQGNRENRRIGTRLVIA